MKNNFPIGFRKALENQIDRFKHQNLTLENTKDKGDVFTYKVLDLNFFFRLRNFKNVQGKMQCTIDYRPINRENFSNTALTSDLDGTSKLFKSWLDIIEEVQNYKSVLDYNFIYEQYDKELFDLNNYDEENINDDLLTISAQIKTTEILDFLSNEIKQIPEYQDNKELSDVLLDIEHVSNHIGEFRKKQVFKLTARYLSVIRTHYFPAFMRVIKKIDINKTLDMIGKGLDIYLKLKNGG